MSAPPDALVTILSAVPGRTRVSVPRRRRTAAELRRIAEGLQNGDAVHRVETSVRTGTVLVHHDRDVLPEAALGPALRDLDLTLIGAGARPRTSALRPSATPAVDPRLLLPAGFAVLALRQLVRGAPGLRNAPWYQLAWYAWDSYLKLQDRPEETSA